MDENTKKSLPDMLREYNEKATAATELGLEYRERKSSFKSTEEAGKALDAVESSLNAMIGSLSEPDEVDYNDLDMEGLINAHNELVAQAPVGLECRRMVDPFPSIDDGVWACYLLRARIRHALHLHQESNEKKENDVMVKATKKTAAKKPARTAAKKRNGELRAGSKTSIVADLLRRKSGCTLEDVKEATGWKAVSFNAMAKAAGLELTKEKKDGVTIYYGS